MSEAKAPRPFTPAQERVAKPLLRALSKANVWVYRLSGGRIGGRWLRGAPVGLLVATGRRSGEARTTPLLYLEDGERVVVVASQGGMSTDPLWFRNLEAHPDCHFEIGSERRALRARRATAEERSALWPRLAAMYPDYDDYQARAPREIPVVILEPRGGGGAPA